MTFEKHVIDTLKEWQLKLCEAGENICLYYPEDSVYAYLYQSDQGKEGSFEHPAKEKVICDLKQYFKQHAKELGDIYFSYDGNRICLKIPKEGCQYVYEQVPPSAFLEDFFKAVKSQSMENVQDTFFKYAKLGQGHVIEEKEEDGLGTVFYFDKEEIDPYVYCVEQDVFGITYHRFAKEDYKKLLEE